MAKEKLILADKAEEVLREEVANLSKQLHDMKFDNASSGLANPMEIREVRRNIARYNTELRRREVSAMTPEQLEGRSKLRARRRRG